MDLKAIRELGRKTDRVIEIDRLVKSLQNLADTLLKNDDASLLINLEIEKKEKVGQPDYLSDLFKMMVKESLPKSVSMRASVKFCSDQGMLFSMGKSFQMIILDSMTRALKQEQESLSEEIKIKTGTI